MITGRVNLRRGFQWRDPELRMDLCQLLKQGRRWGIFAVLTVLFAYTHTFALLTVAVDAVFVSWWVFEHADGSIRGVVRQPVFWPALAGFGIVALEFAFWAKADRRVAENRDPVLED